MINSTELRLLFAATNRRIRKETRGTICGTGEGEMTRDIRRFILAIADAAIFDAQQLIPVRNKKNTGEALVRRLNLKQYRSVPRIGDAKYARSLYTAAWWLYETGNEDDEEKVS